VDRKGEFTAKQLACIEYANAHEWDFSVTDLCNAIGIARNTFYGYFDHADFKLAYDGAHSRFMTLRLARVYNTVEMTALNGGSPGVQAAKLLAERFDEHYIPVQQNRMASADGTPLKAYINVDVSAVTGKPPDRSGDTPELPEGDTSTGELPPA
jgi:hypothetical protein